MVDVVGQDGERVPGHAEMLAAADAADHLHRGQLVAGQVQCLHFAQLVELQGQRLDLVVPNLEGLQPLQSVGTGEINV